MLTTSTRLQEWRRWRAELEAQGRFEVAGSPLWSELLELSGEIRRRAHSPYSGLSLAALLLGEDGRLFPGVNVENASYGLTNCAERSAVFHGVGEGQRRFVLCFLQGQSSLPIPPCGACRQVLSEFSVDLWVISRGSQGQLACARLDRLLPGAMGAADLPRA
jgi:cytidine deaminase